MATTAKKLLVWHDSYSWCSSQVLESVVKSISVSSTNSSYLKSFFTNIPCGGVYDFTTNGEFDEFMFVVGTLDTDGGRWDETSSNFPMEVNVDDNENLNLSPSIKEFKLRP